MERRMTEVKPDSETTRLLLGRIRAGERAAFEELFARHRSVLRQLVEFRMDSRLRARLDPSDVVQEAQLEAFRQLPSFLERRPMPFRLWLRKTAQERLRMLERQHLEAARRSVVRELPIPDNSAALLVQQLAAATLSPSQHASQGELARRVADALNRLAEPDREVLLMRTFEGLSYDEVACVLEIDSPAARKRHGRALLRLHKLLTESGLTDSQL
jgi:RNA polymerase sigma-70 factor (ECF subfamily)